VPSRVIAASDSDIREAVTVLIGAVAIGAAGRLGEANGASGIVASSAASRAGFANGDPASCAARCDRQLS